LLGCNQFCGWAANSVIDKFCVISGEIESSAEKKLSKGKHLQHFAMIFGVVS
jgi:hypothetical protein